MNRSAFLRSSDVKTTSLWAVAPLMLLYIASQPVCSAGSASFEINLPSNQAAFDKVRGAVNPEKWPVTSVLRSFGPVGVVGKQFLSNTSLATRENISSTVLPFTDKKWCGAMCTWSWDHLVKNPDPLPNELPAEDKTGLLSSLRDSERQDPNLVKEILAKALERYRSSKAQRFMGDLRLSVCVGPNSQVAYDYLILQCTSYSSFPSDLVIAEFSDSNKLEGLGTTAFGRVGLRGGRIMFVRDNIAVYITTHGDMAAEALPLARKIDALILQQPSRTREELAARAPSITISGNLKTNPEGQKSLPFETSAPVGQRIVKVAANAGEETVPIRDTEISLGRRVGKTKIKVLAITDELLVGTREIEVDIPAD
jgi:hypothetical protein